MLEQENPKTMKSWENKLELPGKLSLHMKNGGSSYNADQPFVRTESLFNKMFKMEKLIKCVSRERRGSLFS